LLPPKVGQSVAALTAGVDAQPHALATAQDRSAFLIRFMSHP
jgi:hypothetical protein